MKETTRVEKNMKFLLEAMKKGGVNVEPVDTKSVAKEAVVAKPSPSYTAEAVLLFIERPARFAFKECKKCKEMFGTNYRSVAYCSDNCRIAALKKLGVIWTPGKNQEERWGGEPPLIIPPAALQILLHLASLQPPQGTLPVEQLEEVIENTDHEMISDSDENVLPVFLVLESATETFLEVPSFEF